MVSVGQELGKDSAEQFLYGVSQVTTVRSQLGMVSLKGETRLEDPLLKWLTHLTSKSVLAVGQRPQLLSTWAPHAMVASSCREQGILETKVETKPRKSQIVPSARKDQP